MDVYIFPPRALGEGAGEKLAHGRDVQTSEVFSVDGTDICVSFSLFL